MYIKWNITRKCSGKCKFCKNVNNRLKWGNDLKFSELEKIVKNISKYNNIKGITLMGGEPFEYDNLFFLLDLLNEANIKFGFVTSGINISKTDIEKLTNYKNFKFIGFSIDALNKNIVNNIRGEDVLEKQLKNINEFIKKRINNNFKIFTNTILMKLNLNYILDLIDYLINIEVDKIQILSYQESDVKKDTKFNISFEEELNFVNKLSKYIVESERATELIEPSFLTKVGEKYLELISNNIYKVKENKSKLCPIYRDTIFLNNQGYVYPCDTYKPYIILGNDGNPEKNYNIESLLDNKLKKILKENDFFSDINNYKSNNSIFSNWSPCSNCEYLFISCIPCLNIALNNLKKDVSSEKCEYYFSEIKKRQGDIFYE